MSLPLLLLGACLSQAPAPPPAEEAAIRAKLARVVDARLSAGERHSETQTLAGYLRRLDLPPGAVGDVPLVAERPGGVAVRPFFAPACPMTLAVTPAGPAGTHRLDFEWSDADQRLYKARVDVDPAAGTATVSPGTSADEPVAGDLRVIFPNRVQVTVVFRDGGRADVRVHNGPACAGVRLTGDRAAFDPAPAAGPSDARPERYTTAFALTTASAVLTAVVHPGGRPPATAPALTDDADALLKTFASWRGSLRGVSTPWAATYLDAYAAFDAVDLPIDPADLAGEGARVEVRRSRAAALLTAARPIRVEIARTEATLAALRVEDIGLRYALRRARQNRLLDRP